MKGRGRNDPHTSGAGKGKGFEWPLVAIDYGYLKENNSSGRGILLLCASEAKYGMMQVMIVPEKGNGTLCKEQKVAKSS